MSYLFLEQKKIGAGNLGISERDGGIAPGREMRDGFDYRAVRTDRFSEGAVWAFFESGAVGRRLLQLKETGDKEDLKRRIESEAMAAGPGTKDTLQCRDCLSQHDDSARLGNAAKCEAYPACRPNSVLLGGA